MRPMVAILIAAWAAPAVAAPTPRIEEQIPLKVVGRPVESEEWEVTYFRVGDSEKADQYPRLVQGEKESRGPGRD